MRHHRKLTDDERRQIIAASAEGSSAVALAHQFGVSRRTIYNALSKAKGPRQAPTRTISTRLSERQLVGFKETLARRSITDQPAALRCLMGAADILLRPADLAMFDQLHAWGADIATRGAAINHIARKLNEAKLRGSPIPFTAEDMATIGTFAGFFVDFSEEFRALWEAKQAALTREVDKALAELATMGPDP
jgi:transposase-like protein